MNGRVKGLITGFVWGWFFLYFGLWIIACYFPWEGSKASWYEFLFGWAWLPILHPDYIYGLPVILANALFWMALGAILPLPNNGSRIVRKIFFVALIGLVFGLFTGVITSNIQKRANPSAEPGISRWYDWVETPGIPGFIMTCSFGDWIYSDERADDTPDIALFNGTIWMNLAASCAIISHYFRSRRTSSYLNAR